MGEVDGAAQRVSTAGEVGAFASKKHRTAHTTPPPMSHRSVQQPQAPTTPRAHNTRHREGIPHHDSNKTKPALPFSPDPG